MALAYNNLYKINFAIFGFAYSDISLGDKYANITFLSVVLFAYIIFLSAVLFSTATKINKFFTGYRPGNPATADNLNLEIDLI